MTGPAAFRVRVAPAPGAPEPAPVEIRPGNPDAPEGGGWRVDGTAVAARLEHQGPERAVLHGPAGPSRLLLLPGMHDALHRLGGTPGATVLEVVIEGWRLEVTIEDAVRAALRERATRRGPGSMATVPVEVRAIIAGRVAAVSVAQGDVVVTGQGLLVVEAMKMQNELRAPRGGTVGRVAVDAGQTVEAGALLVVIE